MYLGVDYYPEQWDRSLLESDLERMVQAGVNCIRLAEFAWHLLEPSPGQFDFSFFQEVMDRAHHHGIRVMLGTPTATMPAWLVEQHPEVLSCDEQGQLRHFGGRRQACLNSPAYQEASDHICRAMAQAYASHPAVVAWQIDNELGHEGSDWCYCQHCQRQFQHFLSSAFEGQVSQLNARLGLDFWAQCYDNFQQIEVPRPTIPAKNPGLMLYFYRFRAWTLTQFTQRQAALLRSLLPPQQEITHNYPGDYYNKAQNFAQMSQCLDAVALNNYPVWGGLEEPVAYGKTAMKLAQTRGFLQKPFWITEQLIGAQAHTIMGYLPRPGQARLWSWQAFLSGCRHLLYFRWRTATRGAEQFCYGVLDHDNRDGPRLAEMKQVFHEARALAPVLEQRSRSQVALLYHPDNIFAWKIQPQSTSLDIHQEHFRLYQGFKRLNFEIDVLDIDSNWTRLPLGPPSPSDLGGTRLPLEPPRVVLLPAPMLLSPAQIQRLGDFMRRGGSVICSFRAGLKDLDNACYFNQPNPWLDLAQVDCATFESLGSRQVQVSDGSRSFRAGVWRDMLRPRSAEVEVLLRYCDEFRDYAAATCSPVGQGRLICVGCAVEDEEFWIELATRAAAQQGLSGELTPYGLEIFQRGDVRFWLNHRSETVEHRGRSLQPYEVVMEKWNYDG